MRRCKPEPGRELRDHAEKRLKIENAGRLLLVPHGAFEYYMR